ALGCLAAWVALRAASPPVPHRRLGLRELLASESGRLRAVARGTSLAALAIFLLLAFSEGPPASPEGGVLGSGLEHDLQLGLLGFAAVAVAAAWWRDGFGGLLLVAGFGLGSLAALEYTPLFAVLACLVFAVPGVLFLLAWERVRGVRELGFVAVAVTGVFALGAVVALELHAQAYGPATPQSSLPVPETWRVKWAWAGGVTGEGVTVKARLNDDARVRLLVGPRRDLRGAAASAAKQADDARNERIVAFRMEGLEPGRRYHYGLEVDGRVDPYRRGSFRTFPAGRASFEIAFAGCARVGSDAAAFEAIRRERPLLFLSVGDFFYANIEENAPGLFLDQYDRALGSPAQGALYRSTAFAYVWDDHDFGGDGSDASAESAPAARSTYRLAVPHYALPGGPGGGIQQAFTIGRVRFVVMDARSRRTGESMLGAEQLRWVKRQLLAARDRYALTVLVSSVPWIERPEAGVDGWGAYPAERAELSRFIARHRIRRLVMLSGDAHMLAIDDGSHSDYSGSGRAGFPVMHAAALDRPGSVKGGPYSEGAFPGAGQYGTMRVEDEGDRVRVTLVGHDYRGREVVRYSFGQRVPR
ncbi:MAG TPA: alkaline phosphatase D family protein, partial [Solirubrobacterales bacterium]|nr:alkaline phosphatase D family protein [Solirubrobacterales bacterium]